MFFAEVKTLEDARAEVAAMLAEFAGDPDIKMLVSGNLFFALSIANDSDDIDPDMRRGAALVAEVIQGLDGRAMIAAA